MAERSKPDPEPPPMVAATSVMPAVPYATVAVDINISPAGEEQTRPLKKSMLLTCSADGLDSPDIDPHLKWFHDGNEITDRSGKVYLESDGVQVLKLYFSSIENSDVGTYTCQGEIDGNHIKKTIRLNLFNEITFDDVPPEQFPRIYSDALIICRVSGQPTPTVSWRYRGKKIQPSNHYILEQDGLKIMNISEDDNGRYVCYAEVQQHGRYYFKDIDVVVHIPPKITKTPGAVEGIEGHEFSITCKASGKPSPKYQFYRGDSLEPIKPSDRVQLDADGGALNFRPLSRDDHGQYTCVAINVIGEDRAEGKLTVIGELEVAQINYDGITVFVAFFLYWLCDIELSNSTSSDLNKRYW
ncbi:Fasciclin-2 [Lamellibrachia satsuma]|nr:Fasciclin-2 [Lamellibrachia satsuma]